ncbi:radical SAM protein [Winogradskyella tangerina]|uniref:radical SAM protein n=1 Tax=Winogradskyella tangerina TaxID=2023240 RepID=UPI000DBE7287|nr:radical SAM protein [Winogradskyella tangerina]
MKFLKTYIPSLILKVASRCNLNCSYCYLYNHLDNSYLEQPKFMSLKVLDKICDDLNEILLIKKHPIEITLHGGEPMLMKEEAFEAFIKKLKERLGNNLTSLSIQTNATLINSTFIKLIKQYQIGVSVSLDGTKESHDKFRLDHKGEGSYESTIKGIHKLISSGIDVNILCVIDPYTRGDSTYNAIKKIGVKRMSFLIPDVTHDSREKYYHLLPKYALANYLISLFIEWQKDHSGIRIRLFEDIISAILGGVPKTDLFGGNGLGYVIVESNGNYELLDALKVCYDGSTKHHKGNGTLLEFMNNVYNENGFTLWQKDYSAKCLQCRNFEVCKGGYLPHRYSDKNNFKNESVWCDDLYKLIDFIRLEVSKHLFPHETSLMIS